VIKELRQRRSAADRIARSIEGHRADVFTSKAARFDRFYTCTCVASILKVRFFALASIVHHRSSDSPTKCRRGFPEWWMHSHRPEVILIRFDLFRRKSSISQRTHQIQHELRYDARLRVTVILRDRPVAQERFLLLLLLAQGPLCSVSGRTWWGLADWMTDRRPEKMRAKKLRREKSRS